MKKILLFTLIYIANLSYSQVGINTNEPKATLDVVSTSFPMGVIAPRVTGDNLKANDANYKVEQNGAIVYVTEPVDVPSDKTEMVITRGYYYYDAEVELWYPIGGVTEPWHNEGTGKGATSNSQNIYQLGKVGVGVTAIDPSAQFQVNSNSQGVLLTSMATTDRNNIANPANGLLIFNTTTGCFNYYDGLASKWQSMCGAASPSVAVAECANATAYGTYQASVPMTSSNYIQLPITVTQEGSLNIIITTNNGYSFAYSTPLISTGSYTLPLSATGVPVSQGTTNGTVSVNGVTMGGCNVTMTVAAAPSLRPYTLNCSSGAVNGSYYNGVALTGSNTMTIQVTNSSPSAATAYSISTNTVAGMSFSGSGSIPAGATVTVTLTGSGTPTSAGLKTFTISSNSTTSSVTCTKDLTVLNVKAMKILSYAGSSGQTPGTSNGSNSVDAMLYKTSNFGPSGTVKVQSITVTSVSPTAANLAGKDIAIISTSPTTAQATALANFANAGGIVIILDSSTTTANNIFSAMYGWSSSSTGATGVGFGVNATQAKNVNHPILNGPFGDIRTKYIGEDSSYSQVVNLPGTATNLLEFAANPGKSWMLVDDGKNFFFIGDDGPFSGNDSNTSTSQSPNKHSAGTPVVKNPYNGSTGGVYNSTLYVNVLAWAINKVSNP